MLGNLFSKKTEEKQVSEQLPIVPPDSTLSDAPSMTISSAMQPQMRQDLSVLTHMDARSVAVLHQAEEEAKRIKQEKIEPGQLLYGLLFDNDIFQLVSAIPVDAAKISREIQVREKEGSYAGQPTLSDQSKQVLEEAYTTAKGQESDFVAPEHILIALYSSGPMKAFLESQGIKKEQLVTRAEKTGTGGVGKRSALEKFGIDMTQEAKEGKLDPVIGRDKEVERLVHILLRRTKNNPIIIGEAGTGKTALVEGLAEAIAQGTAPEDLKNKSIIRLDVSSLVAGASHRGEFEERLRSVIKEVQAASGQVILFIDEVHTLIGTGDTQGALDASNIIKPFLARGQLQMIGTTTTAEYRKYFEKDKAFERRFQPIVVEEPDEETAVKMLEVLKPKYESFHKVVMTPESLEAAVHLSKKYIGERYLPDKAVDLLDEAAADVRLMKNKGKGDGQVRKTDIEKVVSAWTGIPITKLTEDEGQKLLNLESIIHKRLVGQDGAVQAVAEAVRRGRIGLANANRPIASFIFLGPTGTGKTELAKTLAEILFGKEDAMIRLDMSEYMEKHEVAKLIGAPPGYVGYEEGGQLTEAVRRKPYSVVLLDEVEKAHPDVFNILLQLLEDGRLTDNKGNTISFKNTIIICTSNIGSTMIQQQMLQNVQSSTPITPQQEAAKIAEVSKLAMDELRKFFRPELLNRFDETVVFEPLKQSQMIEIAKLRIQGTRKLLQEQGIDLAVTEKGLGQLAKEGYDPIYGARPLRRLIQTAVENPIALLIIKKQFMSGDKVLIDYDDVKKQYAFSKAPVNNGVEVNIQQSGQAAQGDLHNEQKKENGVDGQSHSQLNGQLSPQIPNQQIPQQQNDLPLGNGILQPPASTFPSQMPASVHTSKVAATDGTRMQPTSSGF